MALPRSASLLVVLALASMPAASAEPVEVSDTSARDGRLTEACALWIEPAGLRYEWTVLCGHEAKDADGVVTSRDAYVYRTLCDGQGAYGRPDALRGIVPDPGTACDEGSLVVDGDLQPGELFVDLEAGLGGLHADVDGCVLRLAWTASPDSSSSSGGFVVADTDGRGASVTRYEMDSTRRDAALSGAICPRAEVEGEPRDAWIARLDNHHRRIGVRVNPPM